MGVDAASARGQALRSIAGTWRDRKFGDFSVAQPNRPALVRFLDLFDFDHCERLIRFLRQRVQQAQVTRKERKTALGTLAANTTNFAALSEPPLILDLVSWAGHAGALASWEQYLGFITDPQFAADCLKKFTVDVGRMLSVDDDGRNQRVKWLFADPNSYKILSPLPLGQPAVKFEEIVNEVARQVIAVYGGEVHFDSGLTPPLAPVGGKTALQQLLDELERLFAEPKYGSREIFDRRDVEAYPIVFGTDLGEYEPVEIFRISPNETTEIAGTSPPGCVGNPALRGASLDAFGAFLDPQWRLSDMLRGRLDGAERLITSVLPDSDDETKRVREDLIKRAQEEIAREWPGFEKGLGVKPSEQKMKLINQLREYAAPLQAEVAMVQAGEAR